MDGEGGKSRGGLNSAYERSKRTVRVPILVMLIVQGLLNFKSTGHKSASWGQGSPFNSNLYTEIN